VKVDQSGESLRGRGNDGGDAEHGGNGNLGKSRPLHDGILRRCEIWIAAYGLIEARFGRRPTEACSKEERSQSEETLAETLFADYVSGPGVCQFFDPLL